MNEAGLTRPRKRRVIHFVTRVGRVNHWLGRLLSQVRPGPRPAGGAQEAMPAVAEVAGVAIQFFFGDQPPPHFHARFAGHQARIALNSWDVVDGSLPAPELRAVLDWARAHEDELAACWNKAAVRQPPGKIG